MQTPSPFASFCMATYKRPALLRKTLRAIAQQQYQDFEVIVSDNDPEGSAGMAVAELNDARFRHFANAENIGMVNNFNRALSRASGEFIVFITDDDPPYEFLLEALRGLYKEHPNYGAYYGGGNTKFENAEVAHSYGLQMGLVFDEEAANSPEGNRPHPYSADEFPVILLNNGIKSNTLWSCGMVRRDVALSIGGLPDYGSPYMADYAYIALAGAEQGCVLVDRIMGYQTVHEQNFGRREFTQLRLAVEGFYQLMSDHLQHKANFPEIQITMQKFLGNWIATHGAFLKDFFKDEPETVLQLDAMMNEIYSLPYMSSHRWKYVLKDRLPWVTRLYRTLKRIR